MGVQELRDFYKWATTVPETKPMVYAPTGTSTSTKTTVPTQTTTSTPVGQTTTPTNKTIDPTAGMNDAGLALYNKLIGGTPAPTIIPQNNVIPNTQQTQPQIVYREPEFDPTEMINQLKDAVKTEGPVESPDLEDDSENDDEVIE